MHRSRLIVLVVLTALAVQVAVIWHNGDGSRPAPAAAGAPERQAPAATLLRWIDRTRDVVTDRLRVRIEVDGRSITISFGPQRDRRPLQISIPEEESPRPGRFLPLDR